MSVKPSDIRNENEAGILAWIFTGIKPKWDEDDVPVLGVWLFCKIFIKRLTHKYVLQHKECDIIWQHTINIFINCLTMEKSLMISISEH